MKNSIQKAIFSVICAAVLTLGSGTALFAGGSSQGGEKVTINVAAAASLKNVFDDALIPAFEKAHPNIKVQPVYASSGALQTQIEQGLKADVFMSAAVKQMDALVKGGFINKADVVNLLNNNLVLIKPVNGTTKVTGFKDIAKAKTIAIGDPASVPAGQYAQEALTKLGIWKSLPTSGLSLGSNVTEVLNWVGQGSAEVGIVYATDAASSKNVAVIAVLEAGVLAEPVIYPVAVCAKTEHPAEAALFADFLKSGTGIAAFKKYGFAENAVK
jgi:molybdate transport system substrate-binding protein